METVYRVRVSGMGKEANEAFVIMFKNFKLKSGDPVSNNVTAAGLDSLRGLIKSLSVKDVKIEVF